MTVAVIGATGTVGPCVVSSLHARGADIRVLTRDADRSKSMLAPGIEIRPVDIGDHDEVIAACTGVASVLLLTSHAHDTTDLQLPVALTTDAWDGQTLVLTGPRPVTYAELAAIIGRQSGRPVEIKEITPADVRAMMTARGTPQWEAEHFEEMYEMFRRGESEFVSDVERITGHRPRDVEAYLGEALGDRTDPAAR